MKDSKTLIMAFMNETPLKFDNWLPRAEERIKVVYPFQVNVPFLYNEKIQITASLLMFSGRIEM